MASALVAIARGLWSDSQARTSNLSSLANILNYSQFFTKIWWLLWRKGSTYLVSFEKKYFTVVFTCSNYLCKLHYQEPSFSLRFSVRVLAVPLLLYRCRRRCYLSFTCDIKIFSNIYVLFRLFSVLMKEHAFAIYIFD